MPHQEGPDRRCERCSRSQPGDARAGDEQQREGQAGDHHGGAEVGLEQEQQGRDAQHQQVRQHTRGEVADSILLAGEGPGEPEDQGQLDHLAGLELERAHREPPPRSARRAAQAGHVHQRQEDEREKEEGDGQFLQTPVADPLSLCGRLRPIADWFMGDAKYELRVSRVPSAASSPSQPCPPGS